MKKLLIVLYAIGVAVSACCFLFVRNDLRLLSVLLPLFLIIYVLPGFFWIQSKQIRLHFCCHGAVMLVVFLISTAISIAYHIGLLFSWHAIGGGWMYLASVGVCVAVEAIVFWNGMLCIYLTSVQLGIKHRVIGALCGLIPVVNLIVLGKMLQVVFAEIRVEAEKERIDAARAAERVCETKYPIMLVHGVFFRDFRFLNYWGRIPKALETNGAKVYYGKQHSAATVADCALELKTRIAQILQETGCEKVNIIAHSKGGLDSRYAIAYLGVEPYVASLTTINTPHRGCEFADFLLSKVSAEVKNRVAKTYNATLHKLGEENPDFMAAVNDLTASACVERDKAMGVPDTIFCQSIGSVMPKASGGRFPMNYCYLLVKCFDGRNDGLVGEESFQWGQNYRLLEPKGKRGISHGDMIDLNRENIEEFDVREFYVQLVADLKNRGL